MIAPAGRRGFTLVELLVVTGLFVVFFGLVVNGLRPNPNSQVRQLSQAISSAILATQTRALGNETGAALIFDVGGGTLASFASNTVLQSDVPPFILGGTAPPAAAYASGTNGIPPMFSGSLALSASFSPVTLSLTNADAADLANGYKIRFLCDGSFAMPPSPWFKFSPVASSTSGTVSLRVAAGQTITNTTWPSVPAGGVLRVQIARFPVKTSPAIDVTKQAAIDLRYSGIGNTISGDYGNLNNKGPIAITFDRNGRLDAVMQYGTSLTPVVEPSNPTAPLYLLIATLADIQDNRSLQSQSSRWLAIAPNTGRVTIAANIPAAGTSENDVLNARANARQGATGGVK